MADDASDILSLYQNGGSDGHAPPVTPDPSVLSLYPQPPPPAPPQSVLQTAWQSLRDHILADSGDATPQPLKDAPIQSPFFSGIAHGARTAIDRGAEALASTFGGDADAMRADRQQRQKDYEADPANASDSTGATIGRAVGSGLVYGGGISGAGRLAAAGLEGVGATALPYVGRGLEYLSGGATAAPGAGLPTQLATRGASLAAQGGATGGVVAGLEADPNKSLLPQIAEGVATGAIASPLAGSAVSAATLPLRAGFGLLPNVVRQQTAELADRLMNHPEAPINLDPTMLTTNPTYRLFMDQAGKMPFAGAAARRDAARLQWQQALTHEMGSAPDPAGITHDVMDATATRIGQTMDGVLQRTGPIAGGTPLLGDVAGVAADMQRFPLTPDQRGLVRSQIRNVLDSFQGGMGDMTPQGYQNLTQTGGPLDALIQNTDPTVAAMGMRLRNAVDAAFQRAATPEDQAALQQARYQYRVMKTVQPLVEQKGLTGDIDPHALAARVRAQSARFDPSTGGIAYTGGGRLGDLAYGGQMFFSPQPDSGTAARTAIMAGLLGGGLGTAVAHPAALAAPAATLAVNAGVQRMLRSPQVAEAMVRNTLRPPGPWVQRVTPGVTAGLLGP